MSKKLSNAPVYFAIVQARFNPILALDSYAPAIQDSLRRQGFPDAQRGILNTFNLALNAQMEGSPGQVPVSQVPRYTFQNMERMAGFILEQGALSFQTTNYDVFETFSKTFLSGLDTVNKAVGLSYTDRIGLRYLDAVFPKAGDALPSYLNGNVLGLYEESGGQIVHSFSETVFKVDEVSVTARTIIQDGPLGFPPDLQPELLVVPDRFRSVSGAHAVLDTDGWVDRRDAFQTDVVQDRLLKIHGEVVKAFTLTVTDYARSVWK